MQNTNKFLAPEGTHQARCFQIRHIGSVRDVYQGKETWPYKIRFWFELPNELVDGSQHSVKTVYKELNRGFGSFYKFLEAWRGREFTEEERVNFNVSKVLGAPCVLTIRHLNGYAVIDHISPIAKGTIIPPAVNIQREYTFKDYEEDMTYADHFMPFEKKQILSSKEYQQILKERATSASEEINLPF